MRYKVIIYQYMSLREWFIIDTNLSLQEISKKIAEMEEEGIVCLVDIKGVARIYNINDIKKIEVREV